MFNSKIIQAAVATFVVGAALSQAASAQGITTLRDPLIPGAQETAPIMPAVDGPPPPPGCGPTPWGVTPGMPGSPGFEPWVPNIPADTINSTNSGIGLPVSPPIALPPGVLGPALTPIIPNEPNTPGAAPPYLYVDGNNPSGLVEQSEVVQVNPGADCRVPVVTTLQSINCVVVDSKRTMGTARLVQHPRWWWQLAG